MKEEAPNYLINLIRTNYKNKKYSYANLSLSNRSFQVFFFSSSLKSWFNLADNIKNFESILLFKSRLLLFSRPVQNSVLNIFNPWGLKLVTRSHLGFGNLNEHRHWHNFENCINLLCFYSLETKYILHYLLHCHYFSGHRFDLTNSVKSVLDNFESKAYFYMVTHS